MACDGRDGRPAAPPPCRRGGRGLLGRGRSANNDPAGSSAHDIGRCLLKAPTPTRVSRAIGVPRAGATGRAGSHAQRDSRRRRRQPAVATMLLPGCWTASSGWCDRQLTSRISLRAHLRHAGGSRYGAPEFGLVRARQWSLTGGAAAGEAPVSQWCRCGALTYRAPWQPDGCQSPRHLAHNVPRRRPEAGSQCAVVEQIASSAASR